MTDATSQADRFRRAREEFSAAMEAGCSILELRRRRKAARALLRDRAQAEVADHTAALMDTAEPFQGDFLAWDSSWMLRD